MKDSNNGFVKALISFGYAMIVMFIVYCGFRGMVLLLYPNDDNDKIRFRTVFGMWIWLLGSFLYIVILGNMVSYDNFEAIVGWPVIVISGVIIILGNFICALKNDY